MASPPQLIPPCLLALQYMEAGHAGRAQELDSLLPVIATVLQFSPQEFRKAKGSGGSWTQTLVPAGLAQGLTGAGSLLGKFTGR